MTKQNCTLPLKQGINMLCTTLKALLLSAFSKKSLLIFGFFVFISFIVKTSLASLPTVLANVLFPT